MLFMENNEIKKTSLEWYEEVRKSCPTFIIYDPDGWDRKNYEFSFNQELVTKEEFQKRLFSSTVLMGSKDREFFEKWK